MILILITKILSLALIMLMGYSLVKCKVLRAKDSEALSKMTLYLIMPCVILSAFQVDYTPEVQSGLILSFLAGTVLHAFLLLLNTILKKTLRLDEVEQTSVIYSNAGNLIVPLVTAMLGTEWVIYTSGFMVVQLFLLWSHGKSALCKEKGLQIKKVLLNPNMIAIMAGVVLFFTRIRFPALIQDAVGTVSSMVGPVAMLVTGMLLGGMNLRQVISYKRVWLITAMRLLLVPLLILPILKFTGLSSLAAGGDKILLVTFLAVTTPSASTVTQLSQVYGSDEKYACAINVLTTILCVLTIPLMVMLYQG